jgi:hypothetical protein
MPSLHSSGLVHDPFLDGSFFFFRRLLAHRSEREAVLANTEALLLKLTAVHTDTMLLDVYKDATVALNSATAASGMTPDAALNVLDDLAEAIAGHDEVAAAVAAPIGGDLSAQEQADLDREFSELFQPATANLLADVALPAATAVEPTRVLGTPHRRGVLPA